MILPKRISAGCSAHDDYIQSTAITPDRGRERTGTPQLSAHDSALPTTQETSADALAIAELCLLAGVPERTAEFLANATPAAQVRRVLLDARAQQPQIVSRITDGANTEAACNPLITAVKKMIGKE